MIGKAVYSILTSSSPLAALVGTKFYPVVMPEGTLMPCIVWQINGTPEYTKSSSPADMTNVTFTVFAEDYDGAVGIFLVLRTEMENVRGVFNGVTVAGGRVTNYSDGYDREAAAFLYQVNFNFRHK